MSSSRRSPSAEVGPSILKDLRKFRFEKKPVKKMFSSDEDETAKQQQQQQRKPAVNRIVESDEDDDNDSVNVGEKARRESEIKAKEDKLNRLIDAFPKLGSIYLQEVLNECDWDVDAAKGLLGEVKKRPAENGSKSKKHKRKKYNDGEDGDVDSDDENYSRTKVFDSDDESDVEVSDDLSGDKKAVLEFMSNAVSSELLLLHQCTQKKVTTIIESRPFNGWIDLVQKFQNTKSLGTELLNAAQDLINTRQVVSKLMKKCLRLSSNIERAVAAGLATIKEQPKGIPSGLQLASYQMVGLNWLAIMHAQKVNGILADEMGLGKTVQVIAFLTYLQEANLIDEDDGPHLIIVPSSTIDNWTNELERWSPDLKVAVYYGNQDERREIRYAWRNGALDEVDVILTTYNLVSSTPEERRLFRVLPINYVVFDEAHMLKNMTTIRYENLVKLNAKFRLLLTGTPLQNNLLELMSLLIFVMPSMFAGKQNDLKTLFSKNPKVAGSQSNDNKPAFEEEQIANAKEIMKPFILRRLKSEVLKDLPQKTYEVIHCPMTKKQAYMYNELMAKFSAEVKESSEFDGIGMMMKLRKLANHPLLHLDYYDEKKLTSISRRLIGEAGWKQKNAQYTYEDLTWMSDFKIHQLTLTYRKLEGFGLPDHLILDSGKFEKLDELLPQLRSEGHRVLIFSQFTMVLDIIGKYLTMRGHRYLRLDGQTPVMERQSLIDQYTEDTDILVFLLSTRAGGLGINLTSADTVIIHDIDFNPYNDKQAEDRCHRVGQTRPVRIIRLLGKDSIEEGMYKIAQDKLNLEKKLTGDEDNDNKEKKNVLKLLKLVLGIEHNKAITLSPSKNGTISEFAGDD